MIINNAHVTEYRRGALRGLSITANCYHVTIKHENAVLFNREDFGLGNWLDAKHRKIVDAIDALERAICEAVDHTL